MHRILAESLVDKKILQPEIEVEAVYKTPGLSGNEKVEVNGSFVLKEILKDEEHLFFILSSTVDGKRIKVLPSAITAIDGMGPERFAQVYNIKPDGTIKARGKKRGRKTKYDRMCTALAQVGYKIPSTFEFTKLHLQVLLDEVFPENANDDPSSIPNPDDVLEILEELEVPVIELTDLEKEHGDEVFWAWD